jgi:hypothetical protein
MSKYEGHTPGPWKVCSRRHISGYWEVDVFTEDGQVCIVGNMPESNAALIAAAPDLLVERDKLKAINAELVDALVKIEGAVHGLYGDAEQSLSIIGGIVGEALIKAKEQDNDC